VSSYISIHLFQRYTFRTSSKNDTKEIDHWNFFWPPSNKNDQDETGTADDQHIAFSSVSSF